jgi:hypothetical protein
MRGMGGNAVRATHIVPKCTVLVYHKEQRNVIKASTVMSRSTLPLGKTQDYKKGPCLLRKRGRALEGSENQQ